MDIWRSALIKINQFEWYHYSYSIREWKEIYEIDTLHCWVKRVKIISPHPFRKKNWILKKSSCRMNHIKSCNELNILVSWAKNWLWFDTSIYSWHTVVLYNICIRLRLFSLHKSFIYMYIYFWSHIAFWFMQKPFFKQGDITLTGVNMLILFRGDNQWVWGWVWWRWWRRRCRQWRGVHEWTAAEAGAAEGGHSEQPVHAAGGRSGEVRSVLVCDVSVL